MLVPSVLTGYFKHERTSQELSWAESSGTSSIVKLSIAAFNIKSLVSEMTFFTDTLSTNNRKNGWVKNDEIYKTSILTSHTVQYPEAKHSLEQH